LNELYLKQSSSYYFKVLLDFIVLSTKNLDFDEVFVLFFILTAQLSCYSSALVF